jgi:formate dehydrogenase subunit gamma
MTTGGGAWSEPEAREALARLDDSTSILLALQSIQATFGYVPEEAVPVVAASCNVSRAEVHGVITFYRDLRTRPPLDHEVRVCMGEACQAVGARALRSEVDGLADEHCEVDAVFCLGNCALGPSAVVDGRLLGRASAAAVRDALGVGT